MRINYSVIVVCQRLAKFREIRVEKTTKTKKTNKFIQKGNKKRFCK